MDGKLKGLTAGIISESAIAVGAGEEGHSLRV